MRPLDAPLTRLATIALVACAALAGCGQRSDSAAALAPASTVVALGDSLTYGTGASAQTSYPSVLGQLTGWNVINAGVPGETAEQGCSRLPRLVDEHRPQLVLVLLGGNDFLRRLPESGIRSALRACIEAAREHPTRIALIPVPRLGFGGLGNAELYVDASREHSVPLVDAGLSDLLARSSMRADRVHLNADGYRAMAEKIAEGLRSHGLLAR